MDTLEISSGNIGDNASSSSSDSSSDSTSGSESTSSDEESELRSPAKQVKHDEQGNPTKVVACGSVVNDRIRVVPESTNQRKKRINKLGQENPTKVVACGSVVNDRIRVVPERTNQRKKRINKANGKSDQLSTREKNKDPDFKVTVKVNCFGNFEENQNSVDGIGTKTNGEGTTTSSNTTSDNQAPSSSFMRKSLRPRTKTPILNERILFRLQHKRFVEEAALVKTGAGKMKPSEEANGHDTDSCLKEKRITVKNRRRPKKCGHNNGNNIKVESLETFEDEADEFKAYTTMRKSRITADWDDYLKDIKNAEWITPVSVFKHAPFSQQWENFAEIGLKIEIPNPFVRCDKPVYWVATIKAFAGYKALVEYESFGHFRKFYGWISFCSDVPKPIGWCDKNDILLFPPYEVFYKNEDFIKKIKSILRQPEIRTLQEDHHSMIIKEIVSQRRFSIMEPVEAMDYEIINRNRIGYVSGIVGDRVFISLTQKRDDPDPGFWFNCKADRVHKIGWSQTVGYTLANVPKKAKFPTLDPETFPIYPEGLKIKEGMVFEVIHPVQMNRIAAAYVESKLKYGYFIARVESEESYNSTRFCFHITSHWLLPCGFASRNGISLIVPCGENPEHFSWETYCVRKCVRRMDLSLVLPRPEHNFKIGCKLEAIDLRQPSFCVPATVFRVAEHLLLLSFDGWARHNPTALQWVEAESPEIYPAGWAEMVGHSFHSRPEPPHIEDFPLALLDNVSGVIGANSGLQNSLSESGDK